MFINCLEKNGGLIISVKMKNVSKEAIVVRMSEKQNLETHPRITNLVTSALLEKKYFTGTSPSSN